MKLIITTPDPEPFSIVENAMHNSYSGLLNSNYKNVVKCSFKSLKKSSVFNTKRRIKSEQYRNCCSVETMLKVSLFLVSLIIAFY